MPRLDFSIIAPQAGAVVGRSIAASGLARVVIANSGNLLRINIDGVRVDFGAGDPVLAAQRTATGWSCTGNLPPLVRGGTQLTVTVVLSGSKQFDVSQTPGEPEEGPPVPFQESRVVTVQVAASPAPAFAVTAPAEGAIVPLGEGGATVAMAISTPGDPLLPVTVSITADGRTTTSPLFAGTQFQTSIDLASMPLGPRPISVGVANVDATAPAQVRTVTGRDAAPPHLTIELPPEGANIRADANAAATVPMQGTAPDTQSGMVGGNAGVAWALTQTGTRTPAQATTGGDFTHWTANVPLSGFGAHTISVWATDQAGNQTQHDVPVNLISSYVPATLAERLNERQYLAALLSFAQEQVLVPGAAGTPPAPLDTHTLVGVLGQPADRLSQPLSAAADRGGQAINELRVPIELLRARIAATRAPAGPGAALESSYRATAYATLLAAVGTSYQELRLARGAAPADRQALAARLGIRLSPTAPDELDRLLLDGPALTEAALEKVFGLPVTTAADPLRAPVTSLLLTWRLTGLSLGWAAQDQRPEPPRTFAVLVDPDVIGAADVVAGPSGNAVRRLLTPRATQLSDYARQLDALRTGAADAASGLASIEAKALPGADLAGLESREAAGTDIGGDLAAIGLTRGGFRYLRRLTRLAATGPLTPAEWSDAIAVLTGAHKSSLYPTWGVEEAAVTLSPDLFVLADSGPVVNPYRVDGRARQDWQALLRSRIAQRQDLIDADAQAVAATEQAALPILRGALLADLAPASTGNVGEELSALFLVDVLAGGTLRTTRLRQAIESVQSLLSDKRSGELASTHPAVAWMLPDIDGFTTAWAWMGELGSWQSATTAFLFPETHLDPALLVPGGPKQTPLDTFFAEIRGSGPFSGAQAARAAAGYLAAKGIAGVDYLNPRRSVNHQQALLAAAGNLPNLDDRREVFWVVPMLLAQRLQSAGDYRAALDWYWIVYPYDLEQLVSCFDRINAETVFRPNLTFPPQWTSRLDPFALVGDAPAAATRPAPYRRYTLLSVIRCHLDFADAEFTRETDESVAAARTLYVTARRLLNAPVFAPQQPTNEGEPALPIPELDALRARATVQLAKLRQGRNIAGMPRTPGVTALSTVRQPTPFRFKSLMDRARQLAAQASQIEAGYLAALEKYDERGLRLFDALKGIDLSAAQTTLAAARVQEAGDAVTAAVTQRNNADVMAGTYAAMIDAPPNRYEANLLDEYGHMRSIKDGIAAADATIGVLNAAAAAGSLTGFIDSFGIGSGLRLEVAGATVIKGLLEVDANGVEAQIQANQLKAGIEQRRTDWRLQQTAAEQQSLVAAAQVVTATDQVAIAAQEQVIATLQHDQAVATVRFLSGQFTNADLYLWMSGTLGGVYRFFLQQATATARLAQSQLAFERAEPEQALVRNDYWQLPASPAPGAGQVDRRGLTGAEQLTADIARLDDYALRSERRRLNLSQTFSLARLMPVEFLDFRRTGTLPFATPMALFDADFPGHYLRLIRQVRTSVVALVPPDRGIRATLYSNGISRVITGRDGTFGDVLVRHDPTVVALTSPVNASGVFELDAQADMLLPFEGSGVDTTWELRLPPAANPFDLGNVVDVMITIDYTALHDETYRSQLVTQLNNDRTRGADCVFSLARDFPDQWYDLNNPADPANRSVTLSLRDLDFPIGVGDITTSGVAVRLASADPVPDTVLSLRRRAAGGEATATGGTASTRRGNAASWTGLYGSIPTGDWTLGFGADAAALFDSGQLDDILLIVGWTGQAPPWTP